uniref:tetraspanin-8-like isoform X2 n=1 Tax=Oncorhynchus gorbuscha TaxID=8017 RepID=UPI001EAF8645|nr:tetraspanin-8-like isoform X2 [Oncorhynchus gorbuscha]XP_046193057.1 tetraspanin-8-like isoform X2 [Oncorhynchus gorbuscha]
MAVNKCIKYLLFLFNLLFWISGCIILGVSIYLKVSKNGNVIMDEAVPFVDLLIAVGVIIMVLGFLGCCGAIKENRCMLILFFIGLLLIFILLLIAGILGAVGEKKSQVWVKESLAKLLPLSDQKPEVQTDLQKLEVEAKCCGLINGPSDWGSTVPSSCDCVDPAQACQSANGRQVYSTLFGMAFAMTLYCQIGKRDANTA